MHTTAELNPEDGWSSTELLFELSVCLREEVASAQHLLACNVSVRSMLESEPF